MRQRGTLEDERADTCAAQCLEHRNELRVPQGVLDDRGTFGSLKRIDEFNRPVVERACLSQCPAEQQQDAMSGSRSDQRRHINRGRGSQRAGRINQRSDDDGRHIRVGRERRRERRS